MQGLELYYEAFMDLMSSRTAGMGIGPIWWTTVQEYIVANGLSEDQAFDMHYHIRTMDTAYMKHIVKKTGS